MYVLTQWSEIDNFIRKLYRHTFYFTYSVSRCWKYVEFNFNIEIHVFVFCLFVCSRVGSRCVHEAHLVFFCLMIVTVFAEIPYGIIKSAQTFASILTTQFRWSATLIYLKQVIFWMRFFRKDYCVIYDSIFLARCTACQS